MAIPKLPDALARRHLLEGVLDPKKAQAYGEAYLEAGREVEAVDFLTRANAKDALATLQAEAIERGDVFLIRATSSALGEELPSSTWLRVAEVAAAGGRERDAETAQRLATVQD